LVLELTGVDTRLGHLRHMWRIADKDRM
jgi:hypothetical protein